MKRVAIYTRVSTDHQVDEGFSLEVQHEKLLDYINKNKLQLFKFYSDPGVSAKNLNRPGIQELLRDFDDGLFDIILVHKLDRLTRNIGDLHNLVEKVNARKKKLISYTEDIDTSTPSGRMFIYFLGVIAQLYRENLGEEVTKGMRKRAQKGIHNITVDLYGYTRGENGELIIIEDEAKWVKWIFEQYVSGIGSTMISRKLNELGVHRNQGTRWNHMKIMRMIKNNYYIGKLHWKSTRDEHTIIADSTHESIISDELFERAQRLLERRKGGLASPNFYEYVFGGIVKCGCCGGSYNGRYKRHSPSVIHRGYHCINNIRYGTCKQQSISEIKLSKLVFDSINLIGKEYVRKDMPAPVVSEEEELRKSIQASENRRERWQMAYGDGNMPYDDFSRRMKEEMERSVELESKLSVIPKQVVSTISPAEAVDVINELKENWEYLEQATRKEIMQSLFQKIVIRKDGNVWHIEEIILA